MKNGFLWVFFGVLVLFVGVILFFTVLASKREKVSEIVQQKALKRAFEQVPEEVSQ